jgi:hypothetical protein
VEQARLVDDAGQGVAVGAEQAVRRPQVELVLAGALELAAVVGDLGNQPRVVAVAQPARDRRVGPQLAGGDLVGADDLVGRRRPVGAIEPERRKEDLVREVGVERGGDVGEDAQVAVDQLGDAPRVVDRAAAAAAGDVQRAVREAEVLLDVDEQEVDAALVGGRRPDGVGRPPVVGGGGEPGGVGPVARQRGAGRHPVRRQGQRAGAASGGGASRHGDGPPG